MQSLPKQTEIHSSNQIKFNRTRNLNFLFCAQNLKEIILILFRHKSTDFEQNISDINYFSEYCKIKQNLECIYTLRLIWNDRFKPLQINRKSVNLNKILFNMTRFMKEVCVSTASSSTAVREGLFGLFWKPWNITTLLHRGVLGVPSISCPNKQSYNKRKGWHKQCN